MVWGLEISLTGGKFVGIPMISTGSWRGLVAVVCSAVDLTENWAVTSMILMLSSSNARHREITGPFRIFGRQGSGDPQSQTSQWQYYVTSIPGIIKLIREWARNRTTVALRVEGTTPKKECPDSGGIYYRISSYKFSKWRFSNISRFLDRISTPLVM